ncbi:MAG: MFS transporter [Ruthenibacterium sp.]
MTTILLVVIYIAFISLGVPDSLLGATWPSMYPALGVPVSFAGVIAVITTGGTILASLRSAWLIRRFGTGAVTAVSVGLTAAALLGFSVAPSAAWLCLCAVPLGLGAGSVDAALNNFVALHYNAMHMSWLHCFWGVGATLGPLVMARCMGVNHNWIAGYRVIGLMQIVLVIVLVCALPMWRKMEPVTPRQEPQKKSETGIALLRLPGAKEALLSFTCYCAVETTTGLWAGSYLLLQCGLSAESAAQWTSAFYFGITAARFVCGFLTLRLSDQTLVRAGQILIAAGTVTLLLPLTAVAGGSGFFLIGLGCAPIFPCLLHGTPHHFGSENSGAMMGLQMASAYVGSAVVPPLFGLVAQYVSIALMPYCLGFLLVVMVLMTERLNHKTAHRA